MTASINTDVRWATYVNGTEPPDAEALQGVISTLKSGRLFRYDDRPYDQTRVGRLEIALESFFGGGRCLAVSSGTAAIALGLMALRLPKGSRVVVPALGFPATPTAVLQAGLVPIVSAVDRSLLLDTEWLDAHWDNRIAAILPIHMRGMPVDMVAVNELATRRGVSVIEDAVPALGATLNGRPVGTFGAVGAFSTQSDKTMNSGEGGFVSTADPNLYSHMVHLSGAFEGRAGNHPFVDRDIDLEAELPLHNFRMDEIRATLLSSELRRIPDRLSQLDAVYTEVAHGLSAIPGLEVRPTTPGSKPLRDSILVSVGQPAGQIARRLRSRGLPIRAFDSEDDFNIRHYANWRFGCERLNVGDLGETDDLLRTHLDIPLNTNLQSSMIETLTTELTQAMTSS